MFGTSCDKGTYFFPLCEATITCHIFVCLCEIQVEYLMKMDTKRAIKLLIDHIEEISPQNVYDQIHAVESAETSRSFKHQYLHSLFEYNPEIGSQFHSLQVSDFPRGLSRWTIATLFRI